jgi:hypothetical protein
VLERSTLRDLEAVGAELVESARWIAVTVKPAVFRAARILEPRLPVAYCVCEWHLGTGGSSMDILLTGLRS